MVTCGRFLARHGAIAAAYLGAAVDLFQLLGVRPRHLM
jgi:hypothetical protein